MGNKPHTANHVIATKRLASDDLVAGDANVMRQRNIVSKYLKRIGKEAKLDLSLDAYGFCYIPFKKFLIIIRVPNDQSGLLYFKTMIFDLDCASGISKVHKRVAAANLTETSLGNRGSRVHMEGDEISLILAAPIKRLTYKDMRDTLEDFMLTAVKTNSNLEAIR